MEGGARGRRRFIVRGSTQNGNLNKRARSMFRAQHKATSPVNVSSNRLRKKIQTTINTGVHDAGHSVGSKRSPAFRKSVRTVQGRSGLG